MKSWILCSTATLLLISACTEQPSDSTTIGTADETAGQASVVAEDWNERLSESAYLVDRVPADALAYLRIPSLWGVISAPKGNNLNVALSSSANQAELEQLQEQLSSEITSLLPPAVGPVVETLIQRQRSPLELVLLPTETDDPTDSILVLSGRFEFSTVELFNLFILETIGQNQGIRLQPQNNGAGIMDFGAVTIHYDYEFSRRRLTAVVGTQASSEQLAEVLSWPATAGDSEIGELEQRIDASGHGLFAWINFASITPLAEALLPPDTLTVAGSSDLLGLSSLALGEGVSSGIGRLSVIAQGEGSLLWNATLPELPAPEIMLGGEPDRVYTARIPGPAWIEEVSAELEALIGFDVYEEVFGAGGMAASLTDDTGMDLAQVIAGIAGHVSFIEGNAGRYLIFSPENPDAFDSMLAGLDSAQLIAMSNLRIDNTTVREIQYSNPFTAQAPEIIRRISTRMYVMRDGDHFLVAQVPQILLDLDQITREFSLSDWIDAHHLDSQKAVISMAGRNRHASRNNYYNYLSFLQILGDLADHEVDISSFPSTSELQLPELSSYGFQLNYAENELAFQLIYDSHPFEYFSGSGLGSAAIFGILAAVALPAYQNYTNRAAFSELILGVTPRKTAVELAIGQRVLKTSDVDGGAFGIPDNVIATSTNHGAAVRDGVITMTWMMDGSALAGSTYQLILQSTSSPVEWGEGGSCLKMGFC